MAPTAVKIQPRILMPPNGARELGNRKIPEPIMFPITRAVAIQKPSFALDTSLLRIATLHLDARTTVNLLDPGAAPMRDRFPRSPATPVS
jgi:hypothetical protein